MASHSVDNGSGCNTRASHPPVENRPLSGHRALAVDLRRIVSGLQGQPASAPGPSGSVSSVASSAGAVEHEQAEASSGIEGVNGGNIALRRQLQAVQERSNLAIAAMEEVQRRQVAKLKRTEQTIEELVQRVEVLEDLRRGRTHGVSGIQAMAMEGGAKFLEQCQELVDTRLREFADLRSRMDGQLEHGVGFRASGQVENLAAGLAHLRVKVDGQLHRMGALAERLETAHEPALDALRQELMQMRSQDQNLFDGKIEELRSHFEEVVADTSDGNGEVGADRSWEADLPIQDLGIGELAPMPFPMASLAPVTLFSRPTAGGDVASLGARSDASVAGAGHRAQALEVVVCTLRGADELADRVAALEEHCSQLRLEETNDQISALHKEPDSLSREVSELQARLLASRLDLLTIQDDDENAYAEALDSPESELHDLAARIAEVEMQLLEDRASAPPAIFKDSPRAEPEAAVTSQHMPSTPGQTAAAFAARLESLEDAFRGLAENLASLQDVAGELATAETSRERGDNGQDLQRAGVVSDGDPPAHSGPEVDMSALWASVTTCTDDVARLWQQFGCAEDASAQRFEEVHKRIGELEGRLPKVAAQYLSACNRQSS